MSARRIACLCAGSVEALYMLGAEEQVVGISGFTRHPARARTEKPKVSGFRSARVDRILEVRPDLVITFSHVQDEIVRELVRSGIEVHAYNQIRLAGILHMVQSLAALTGRDDEGHRVLRDLRAQIQQSRDAAARSGKRPKVFFEYMSEPLTTCIGWVSDLIDVAGGEDCFAELAGNRYYGDRAVPATGDVPGHAPDLIFGSWAGRKTSRTAVMQRPGWADIPAVRNNRVIEVQTADFHVPGPGVVTRGLKSLRRAIEEWA